MPDLVLVCNAKSLSELSVFEINVLVSEWLVLLFCVSMHSVNCDLQFRFHFSFCFDVDEIKSLMFCLKFLILKFLFSWYDSGGHVSFWSLCDGIKKFFLPNIFPLKIKKFPCLTFEWHVSFWSDISLIKIPKGNIEFCLKFNFKQTVNFHFVSFDWIKIDEGSLIYWVEFRVGFYWDQDGIQILLLVLYFGLGVFPPLALVLASIKRLLLMQSKVDQNVIFGLYFDGGKKLSNISGFSEIKILSKKYVFTQHFDSGFLFHFDAGKGWIQMLNLDPFFDSICFQINKSNSPFPFS